MPKTPRTFEQLLKHSRNDVQQTTQQVINARHAARRATTLHTAFKRLKRDHVAECARDAETLPLAERLLAAPTLKCPECFSLAPVMKAGDRHYRFCNICECATPLTEFEAMRAGSEVLTEPQPTTAATRSN